MGFYSQDFAETVHRKPELQTTTDLVLPILHRIKQPLFLACPYTSFSGIRDPRDPPLPVALRRTKRINGLVR